MLSVVVPIYNEEENIPAFHTAIRSVMEGMEEHWEVIYVNDGSRDKSLSLLVEIQQRDPRVSVVEFSRNFGHQAALTAGLQTAKGDAINGTIKLGTVVEIRGDTYVCEDRTARKYNGRFDISCDKDKNCPYQVAGWTTVRVYD